MGERRVVGGCILGDFVGEEACYLKDDHLSTTQNTDYLHNFYADKLKYVYNEPFGYNKCKFGSTLKAALMVKATNGDKKYD
jgi:hypothetical protein